MRVKAFVAKRPRVELVPLLDMFFILLVFFIFGVFSMTMSSGILVDLPAASTTEPLTPEVAVISLTADGRLFLNQEAVTVETLRSRLQAFRAGRPEVPVVINADHKVVHGLVMEVLDTVRQVGVARVAFRTAPQEAQDDPTTFRANRRLAPR